MQGADAYFFLVDTRVDVAGLRVTSVLGRRTGSVVLAGREPQTTARLGKTAAEQ